MTADLLQTLRSSFRFRLAAGFLLFLMIGLGSLLFSDVRESRAQLEEVSFHRVIGRLSTMASVAKRMLLINDISALQEMINSQQRPFEEGFSMVLDADGKVLAHSDMQLLGKMVTDLPPVPATDQFVHAKSLDLIDITQPVISEGVLLGWVRIGLTPVGELALLKQRYSQNGLMLLIVLCLGTGFAYLVGTNLGRKLFALREVAEKVTAGDLSARSGIQGYDDIAVLSDCFNNMLEQLVTGQKQLQQSQNLLAQATKSAGLGLWIWDVPRNQMIWDERMYTLYGEAGRDSAKPVEYSFWSSRVHPEDLGMVESKVQDLIENRGPYDPVFRIIQPNGELHFIKGSAFAERDAAGQVTRLIGFNLDVTEIKRAEQLAKSYQHLVQSSQDAIITETLDGHIQSWNTGAEDMFGYTEDEMLGQQMARLYPPDQISSEQELLAKLAAGKSVPAFHACRIRKDSRKIDVSASLSPILDAEGKVIGASSILRDITAQKQAELAIAKAKEAAELANQAKSAFLATMSHEIRTPLNAIVSTIHLLEHTALSEEQKEDIHTIEISSKNLLGVINDVLDFSKIEAGEMDLDHLPFDLEALIEDVRAMFSPTAAAKGLAIELEALPENLPVWLLGDASRLRQILINLTSNAIKFTENGHVRLVIKTLSQNLATHAATLRFEVQDSGIGIAEEHLPKLFTPFVQGDSSTTRVYGGTGLGLSIVKRIAELMGGKVGVESVLGRGSLFWLELPFEIAQNAPAQTTGNLHRPLHLLVAEDEPYQRKLLMKMCGDLGWDVEGVENGEQMIEHVERRLKTKFPIDCIILDWRMPVMDGVSALAELKSRIGQDQMPSVIMVTAFDVDALQKAIHDVKPDSVMLKPISPSSLFNRVNEAVVSHGQDLSVVLKGTQIKGKHSHWLYGARVMVVDDSELNLSVIGRCLEHEGAKVTLCGSGQEALSALRASPLEFDAVLMDLQMPGMDGCETTENLRQKIKLQLPVIALTAGATTTEQARAKAAGMDDFLTKPVDPGKLIRELRQHIEKYRKAPLPVFPAETEKVPAPPAIAADWPRIPGIDSATASENLGGDVAFFEELLEGFLNSNKDTLSLCKQLINAGQNEEASRRIHKLRGQAGNLGAIDLYKAAGRLEESLNAGASDIGQNLDEAATIHAALMNALSSQLQNSSIRTT